jgi:hypothetical protein
VGETRQTREVIEDHLRLSLAGELEADIERNYAHDVVALSPMSRGRGHEAIRAMAVDLERAMPGARFEVEELLIDGRVALEVWSGRSERGLVGDGVDSFIVEAGLITVMTVHFRVRES